MAEREETDRDNNRQTNKQTTRDFYRSAIVPDRAGRFWGIEKSSKHTFATCPPVDQRQLLDCLHKHGFYALTLRTKICSQNTNSCWPRFHISPDIKRSVIAFHQTSSMATINTPRREQKELFWKTPEKSSENEKVSTLFHEGLRSLLYAPN